MINMEIKMLAKMEFLLPMSTRAPPLLLTLLDLLGFKE
jgi:hypothetical protein